MSRVVARIALAGVMLFSAATFASAQQQSTASETKTFEVIAVHGNSLVVKLPEGTRELTVPDDFRFMVDGQPMSLSELKPGMKGTANVTTRTTVTPVSVTEVKNGTVRQVTGSSIIVQTDQGFRSFNQGDVDKRGVKLVRDGRPASLSDLSVGDRLTATIITSKPPRVVTERDVEATLARSAPAAAAAPAAPAASPAAPASPAPASTVAGGASTTRRLPKTASPAPLLGLVGGMSLVLALALGTARRRMRR
jgi:hypothetical protein